MLSTGDSDNPVRSDSPVVWDELIQAVGPASLLVAIEARLGEPLRRAVAAEDVFQEALLHAWTCRAECEWRGLRAFRSWLLSIIDHRICELADRQAALKRGGGRRALSLDDLEAPARPRGREPLQLPSALVDSNTPSRLAMYREHADAMRAALDQLPMELRDVVQRRLVEQMSLESIAESLNLGIAAVRHRFRRGAELYHRQLKHLLSRQTFDRRDRLERSATP